MGKNQFLPSQKGKVDRKRPFLSFQRAKARERKVSTLSKIVLYVNVFRFYIETV